MNRINDLSQEFGRFSDYTNEILVRWGVSETIASRLDQAISLIVALLFVFVVWIVIDKVGLVLLKRLVRFTDNKWDDVILDNNVLHRVLKIVPAAILQSIVPWIIRSESIAWILDAVCSVYIIVMIVRTIFAVTSAFDHIFRSRPSYAKRPMQVFFQIINVASIFFAGIGIISVVFNKPLGSLMTGLGASMAVILLIFKDSILGFVSGWQLSANDQLRIGDWITVPKYGADGDVIEMSLYAIKVRNFDKTITTIPPYALISDSFQNWRGMQEFGGRRIKRSVFIDISSVTACSDEMMERFSRIEILRDYLKETQDMLDKRNSAIESKDGINVLRQTNIGVFRAYITEYLKRNPEISSDKLCMVRQLQPTEKGIPLEVYCFVADTEWVHYENVQSDIFDHIMAVVPEFGLRIYQYPSNGSVVM